MFRIVEDTYLEAQVPAGVHMGRITVRTKTGEQHSNADFFTSALNPENLTAPERFAPMPSSVPQSNVRRFAAGKS